MLLGIGIGPEQPGRPQVATIESILQSRGGGDIDAKAVLRQITIGAAGFFLSLLTRIRHLQEAWTTRRRGRTLPFRRRL